MSLTTAVSLSLFQTLLKNPLDNDHGVQNVCTTLRIVNCELKLQYLLKPVLQNPVTVFFSRNSGFFLQHKLESQQFQIRGEAAGFADHAVGFSELQQNDLQESSCINPLQIGYNVDDFEAKDVQVEIDAGDGQGGNEGNGGCGSNGGNNNGDEGFGGLEGSDGLKGSPTGWLLWQFNRVFRPQKRNRSNLHFSRNDRDQIIDLAVRILGLEMMPPAYLDIVKSIHLTISVFQELMELVRALILAPFVITGVLSSFNENRPLFDAVVYGAIGMTIAIVPAVSVAVIWVAWRWYHTSDTDHQSDNDEDPELLNNNDGSDSSEDGREFVIL